MASEPGTRAWESYVFVDRRSFDWLVETASWENADAHDLLLRVLNNQPVQGTRTIDYDVDNPDHELHALLAQTGHRIVSAEVVAAIGRIVATYASGDLAPSMVQLVREWLNGGTDG